MILAGKLTAILSPSEGRTTRELAKETGGDSQQLLALLKEMEGEGKVNRTGEKAATRWQAGGPR